MSQDNKKIEDILNSLHNINRAEAPQFFYTRLKARMENELLQKPRPSFLLRPAFLTASLVIIFAINIITLKQSYRHEGSEKRESATIENFADYYNLTTEAVYE